jgi:hypothetical protein
VALLSVGCIFASCYSIPNIHPDSRVSPADKTGCLSLEVDIQDDPAGLVFRITKTRRLIKGSAEWYNLKTGKNIIFVKAPAEEYTLNMVLDRSLKRVFRDFSLEEFPVAVRNGVITYAGTSLVDVSETVNEYQNNVVDFQYSWLDAYADAVEYIRTVYRGIPDTVHVLNESPDIPQDRYYKPTVVWGR